MKNPNTTIKIIGSLLGTLFFGYLLFSENYHTKDYNFLDNNIGQFSFFAFLLSLIYILMKLFAKEQLFPIVLSFLIFGTALTFIIFKIFLWPLLLVTILSYLLFRLRNYLKPMIRR